MSAPTKGERAVNPKKRTRTPASAGARITVEDQPMIEHDSTTTEPPQAEPQAEPVLKGFYARLVAIGATRCGVCRNFHWPEGACFRMVEDRAAWMREGGR